PIGRVRAAAAGVDRRERGVDPDRTARPGLDGAAAAYLAGRTSAHCPDVDQTSVAVESYQPRLDNQPFSLWLQPGEPDQAGRARGPCAGAPVAGRTASRGERRRGR